MLNSWSTGQAADCLAAFLPVILVVEHDILVSVDTLRSGATGAAGLDARPSRPIVFLSGRNCSCQARSYVSERLSLVYVTQELRICVRLRSHDMIVHDSVCKTASPLTSCAPLLPLSNAQCGRLQLGVGAHLQVPLRWPIAPARLEVPAAAVEEVSF